MPSAAEILALVEYYLVTWGLVIIPVGAFLENSVILSFIFPGVTIIFLSGFVARTLDLNLVAVIFLATVGAFLGDNLDYYIGRRAGKILEKKPLFAKPVVKVEPLIAKHGIWAIFAGRFSGWSRAWIALACGVVRYSYIKFAIVSVISALCWTTAWVLGGYLVGGNRQLIEQWFAKTSLLVWGVFAGVIIYYFRTRIKLILDLALYLSMRYANKAKNGLKKDVF